MQHNEKAKLKEKISKEIASIEVSIQSLERMAKPVAPDDAIGRLTRMEAMTSQGICGANLRSSRNRLIKLRKALKNIDKPDFGICEECEEPIPLGRLMIMPESRRCVHCA